MFGLSREGWVILSGAVLLLLTILFAVAYEVLTRPIAATPFAVDSRSSFIRASGKLTQSGTGAGSGQFFIVLDNRVQCFFSNFGLPAGYEQMKRFQKSSATTLIVSGTDTGTMPISGHKRIDNCRIVGWR